MDSVGPPRWVVAALQVREGRDPLGLQTTTQDRLMPRLLPGILELSRRARYFSFHAWLLDVYRQRRLPAGSSQLSTFIRRREWEYGLAVLHCPHQCDYTPVGARRLTGLVSTQPPSYRRGESVESAFGGYGLYYRSPLAALGIVARAGTMLGGSPIPVDVLYDTKRARQLAGTFADAVRDTDYVRSWMLADSPIPREVLIEYARVACLCQLRERPAERTAVHQAIFGEDPAPADPAPSDAATSRVQEQGVPVTSASSPDLAVLQRRRSFAHYLTLVDSNALVVDDESAYREALAEPPTLLSDVHRRVAGQWSALVAKDVWQDALCSIWSQFCTDGLAAARAEHGHGLTADRVEATARAMITGPPGLPADLATNDLAANLAAGYRTLPGLPVPACELPLEVLRVSTDALNTATSGLIVLLELHRRSVDRTDAGWLQSSSVRSAWQPSLATVLTELTAHLAQQPTVADTIWWLVRRYVIDVHERIAYCKLAERTNTFRFRWESGRVEFYDNGIGRFPLAAIRHRALAMLSWDLGLRGLDDAGTPTLTALGRDLIDQALR